MSAEASLRFRWLEMGTSSGTVTLTPASISFGPVPVGTTSAPLQATATNTGAAAVPITGFAITGPFSIASNACGTSALAADSACQLTVAFTPSTPGAATGTLTMTDDAGTQFVQLSGTGEAPPTDTLSPASLSFPATATGQLSAVQTVEITNSGDLPLTSIAVSASAQFQSANNCTTQLAAHSSCTVSVVFAPAQVGVQTGALTVSDLMRTQTVALSGIGVLPAKLTASPTSLAFASQSLGVASAPLTLTISNTGGISAANPGFQISGPGAASFATGTTTCGAALASGGSCSVQVIFTPVATGGSQATLTISSSTNGVTPVEVPLGGSSQAASGLNATPAQLVFAATLVGATSNSLAVAVSNTGPIAAGQLAVTVSGPFTMTQNTCGAALAAGANCTVEVAFAPTSTGVANGTLAVSSPAIANAANVLLSGTGTVAAGLQVNPTSINFTTTGVGQASSATVVTVTNSGSSAALNGLALAVPAGFQLVNNTCTATLAPGLSCTVGVELRAPGGWHIDRQSDRDQQQCSCSGLCRAHRHGLRLHGDRFRFRHKDRSGWDERYLRVGDYSSQQLGGNLHLCVQFAPHKCPVRVQPRNRDLECRRHGQSLGADFYRQRHRGYSSAGTGICGHGGAGMCVAVASVWLASSPQTAVSRGSDAAAGAFSRRSHRLHQVQRQYQRRWHNRRRRRGRNNSAGDVFHPGNRHVNGHFAQRHSFAHGGLMRASAGPFEGEQPGNAVYFIFGRLPQGVYRKCCRVRPEFGGHKAWTKGQSSSAGDRELERMTAK